MYLIKFILFFMNYLKLKNNNFFLIKYGDWGLGIGDWAQSPIPNPQSPIPNPLIFLINIKNFFNNQYKYL